MILGVAGSPGLGFYHRLITEMIQERKTHGRLVDLRDTLIAGIALAHEAQLATRNVRHFSDTTISHLSLIG